MKRTIEDYVNRCGGKGTMHIERLLEPQQMKQHLNMYAKVTIDVDSSLGIHQHLNDSEVYYILEGVGLYNDNGTTREVKVGDVTYTPSGESHGLENIGTTPLVFMALIIKE